MEEKLNELIEQIKLQNKLKAMQIALSLTTINISMGENEQIKTLEKKAKLIISQSKKEN